MTTVPSGAFVTELASRLFGIRCPGIPVYRSSYCVYKAIWGLGSGRPVGSFVPVVWRPIPLDQRGI